MNKYLFYIVILCLVVLFFIGCEWITGPFNKPDYLKNNRKEVLVYREIDVILFYNENYDEFILSYSNFDLTLISRRLNYPAVFTFNEKTIDIISFNEILTNDPRVMYNEIRPGWIEGELLLSRILNDYTDEAFDTFLRSFAMYDLKLLSRTKQNEYFKLSFNHNLINEHQMLSLISDYPDLYFIVDFNGPERFWLSGSLSVSVLYRDYQSFLYSYSRKPHDKYLNISLLSDQYHSMLVVVRFDYKKIDEFKLFNMLENDSRVTSVSFNTYSGPVRG